MSILLDHALSGPSDTMKMVPRNAIVAGCFDLLHAGHVVLLNKSATLGNLRLTRLGPSRS